jgi:CAAX protease family protein
MNPNDPEVPPPGGREHDPAIFSQLGAGIPEPSTDTRPDITPHSRLEPAREPFWRYSDLLLFILLLVPSLAVAALIGVLLTVFHVGLAFRVFLGQVAVYALAFGSLKALLLLRYQQPFWRSLGWRWLSFSSTTVNLLMGLLLAFGVALAGNAIRTPEIPLPFQQMIRSPLAITLFGVLVVILGPLCEELVFRGFMMPLFIRSWGATIGILFTGFLFGLAHGAEYEWSWRHILLISAAGSIFGWARYKTGSTAAGAFMHSTFNLTQFAAFLVQARTL